MSRGVVDRSLFVGAGRRGLTLLEMLLAVSITGLVGLALGTAMTAVSRGLDTAGEARSALQRLHAAHVRMRAYTDAALAVVQQDPSRGMVVWLHDERPGGTINLSEFRVFWFETGAEEIVVERVRFPESWTPEMREAADVELSSSSDFFAEMDAQRALGHTERSTLADGVFSLAVEHNEGLLIDSDRVYLRTRVRVGSDEADEVLLVFGLPAHRAPAS